MTPINLLCYSLYWIIIVQNIIRLNMISLFYKYRLGTLSKDLSKESSKSQKSQIQETQQKAEVTSEVDSEQYVAIVGNQGFWVEKNKFLVAEVKDGMIDPRDAKEIDAFNIPPSQLAYMFRILDKINGE